MRTSVLEGLNLGLDDMTLIGILPYAISLFAIVFLIKCIRSTRLVVQTTADNKLANSNELRGPYREVGKGGFGTVYECRYRQRQAALKLYHGGDDNTLEKEQETTQLSRLKEHSNVVTYYGEVSVSKGQFYNPNCLKRLFYSPSPPTKCQGLLFEWAAHGDLRGYLKRHTLTWKRKLELSKQIVSGLSFVHSYNIVHQDLKPDNILIAGNDRVAKITDFGIARCRSWRLTFNDRTIAAAEADYRPGGTVFYMAPEIVYGGTQLRINYRQCTAKSDIFSLGIVLWEIVTGCFPMRSKQQIINGKFDLKSNRYNLFGLKSVIAKCVKSEPSERPTASQVLKMLPST